MIGSPSCVSDSGGGNYRTFCFSGFRLEENIFVLGWFSLEKPTYITTFKAYDYMKQRFCLSLHDWFNCHRFVLAIKAFVWDIWYFVYFTKWNNHLKTCCNVTMYTIDTFSDPFPRGQWWVNLPKIACLRTQRRYRRDRPTHFAAEIAAIFWSRCVCTVTNKTIVSIFRVAWRYRVLSVRTLTRQKIALRNVFLMRQTIHSAGHKIR